MRALPAPERSASSFPYTQHIEPVQCSPVPAHDGAVPDAQPATPRTQQ